MSHPSPGSSPLRAGLRATVLAAVLGALLSACAGEQGDASGSSPTKKASRAEPSGSDQVAQMVAAVPSSVAASLVDLRFELATRPVAGQPLDVSVALVPSVDNLRSVSVVFQSSEAVEVRSGAEFGFDEAPKVGKAHFHTVSVVPKRDGVSYLSAVVLVDQEGMSIARSYAIPMIVGDSFAASAAPP